MARNHTGICWAGDPLALIGFDYHSYPKNELAIGWLTNDFDNVEIKRTVSMHDFEEMTDGQVNARRNYFMGLWAGRVLGLNPDELNQYVSSVMAADFEEPGPFDVVRKVKRDLEKSGRSWDEKRLLEQLKTFERKARSELCVTD